MSLRPWTTSVGITMSASSPRSSLEIIADIAPTRPGAPRPPTSSQRVSVSISVGWRTSAAKARWRARRRPRIARTPSGAAERRVRDRRHQRGRRGRVEVGDRDRRGRDQHEPLHALGEADRHLGGDRAAHRVADDGHRIELEQVAHALERRRVAVDRDRLGRQLRAAESRQVDGDHAAVDGGRRDVLDPVLPAPAEAVDEEDRRALAGADVDEVDAAARRRSPRAGGCATRPCASSADR